MNNTPPFDNDYEKRVQRAYEALGMKGVAAFENGGEAVAAQDPRSMDLEQWLLNQSQSQLGPVNVQEVRSSKGPGKYDTRISRNEDGFQAFADVDVGDKKLSQLGARYAGRGRIGNYEVQYVLDPETKQPVITGAIRKELSPTSDVSAEGVYVPQKDGKDYYNAGVRYTKRFEKGGDVEATGKFDAEVLANARLSPDYYVQPEPDLIIERASSKGLKDFDRRIAEQSKGTNAAVDPSRYIRKDSTIFPFENKLNVLGWVQSNKPDQIQAKTAVDPEYAAFLSRLEAADPKMQSAFDRMLKKREFDTVVHEMTHANQVKEAFASDKDYERAARLAKRYSKAMELQNYMDKEEYLNPMSGSGLKERELGAYLNSYEGIHPSAKTVSGKQALIPFEKTYLGNQVLPPAKGLDKLLEELGAFGAFSDLRDPETLKYVNKMMGREKRKPTAAAKPKKFEDGGEVTPAKSRVKENLDAIIQGVKNENVSAKDAALFINSFIPVTGDIQSAAELYQALKDKDYLGAGLSGLGLIPGLPAMGGVIKGRKWSDNPGGSWLEHKRKLAADEGMNEFGTPERMGTLTGGFDEEQTIPVSVLKGIRGMRGEQDNVRPDSIEWLTKYMSKTGKLPPTQSGKEYAPFITVDQRGIPYVNEGNHRIMVADKLGWESLPVEIRYFNGGEDMPGIMSPSSIEAMPDLPRVKKTKTKK